MRFHSEHWVTFCVLRSRRLHCTIDREQRGPRCRARAVTALLYAGRWLGQSTAQLERTAAARSARPKSLHRNRNPRGKECRHQAQGLGFSGRPTQPPSIARDVPIARADLRPLHIGAIIFHRAGARWRPHSPSLALRHTLAFQVGDRRVPSPVTILAFSIEGGKIEANGVSHTVLGGS